MLQIDYFVPEIYKPQSRDGDVQRQTIVRQRRGQLSDAFVAAWLPGTEAAALPTYCSKIGYDFRGRLSFSWPATKCGTSINVVPSHIPNFERPKHEQDPNGKHAPLFPFGYGLSYDRTKSTDMGSNQYYQAV